MTLARRLGAATMALVLALFPVALERCRTACVTAGHTTVQAGPAEPACHEAARSGGPGTRMDPMARPCGHPDEVRRYEAGRLGAGKIRSLELWPGVAPLPGYQHTVNPSAPPWRPTQLADRSPSLLNSPLRL